MAQTTIIQPEISLNIVADQSPAQNATQKVLIVGHKATGGSAPLNVVTPNIPNDSASIRALFGNRSFLSDAIIAFKKINKVTQLDAVAQGPGTTAATGTITFVGTATEDGVIIVSIGSKINHTFIIPILSGDNQTDVASKVRTGANSSFLNTTSSFLLGVTTFTSATDGLEGNTIGLSVSGEIAGITYTVAPMSGGTANPGLGSVFSSVEDRYQTIVWPGTFDLLTLKSFIDGRFNSGNRVLDGVGIVTVSDTYANLITLGGLHNSQSLVINGDNAITTSPEFSPSIFEFNLTLSAQIAAIRSLRLTPDQNISRYVISSSGVRDSFGGAHISSFPYFNTPYHNLPTISPSRGFSDVEIAGLTAAGVSVLGNNLKNNLIISGEVVTTYKTDSAGSPDPSFKFLNYVDTLSNIREYFQNNLKSRFAQSRLTQGDLIEGHSMANEGIIRAYMNGLYDTLSDVGFVLTQNGKVANKYFNDNMAIEIDMLLGKVTLNMKVPIVTQLRQIIGTVQVSFSTEG